MKEHLDDAIQDLASWQTLFDPSWFLILKVTSSLIDQDLSQNRGTASSIISACNLRDALKEEPSQKMSASLPNKGLEIARMRDIPFATTKCVPRTNSDSWLVLDRVACDSEADVHLLTKDVRELARKLSSVDPLTFGILQCRGVVRVVESNSGKPSSFDFIFRMPKDLADEAKSLRWYLMSHSEHTLSSRLQLAKGQAKSISFVHTLGFVHKNVRPKTVLGFEHAGSVLGSF